MRKETPLWGRSCGCTHMNQVSGLGLYTVPQLCWTVLPALMPGNASVFFLALLQVNSVEQTLILIVFLKNIELHSWYFIVGCIFNSKKPLDARIFVRCHCAQGVVHIFCMAVSQTSCVKGKWIFRKAQCPYVDVCVSLQAEMKAWKWLCICSYHMHSWHSGILSHQVGMDFQNPG